MANAENMVIIEGNLTRNLELSFSQTGTAYARGGVAWNQFVRDGQDIPHYFDFTLFNGMAENAAASMKVGDRVVIVGRLEFSQWADATTGEKRSKVAIVADSIAHSVRFGLTRQEKISKNGPVTASVPAGQVVGDEMAF